MPELDLRDARQVRCSGRELELVVNGNAARVLDRIKAGAPEEIVTEALTLEEIFVASLKRTDNC